MTLPRGTRPFQTGSSRQYFNFGHKMWTGHSIGPLFVQTSFACKNIDEMHILPLPDWTERTDGLISLYIGSQNRFRTKAMSYSSVLTLLGINRGFESIRPNGPHWNRDRALCCGNSPLAGSLVPSSWEGKGRAELLPPGWGLVGSARLFAFSLPPPPCQCAHPDSR